MGERSGNDAEQRVNEEIREFTVVRSERGIALLLAVFVITIASVIIFELGAQLRLDQQGSRAFSDGVRADYVLKSGLNLARVLLEIPKLDGGQEDWLGEPWALVGSAPSLPIGGLAGEPRLLIVDEDGKIDINQIAARGSRQQQGDSGQAARVPGEFWRDTLSTMLTGMGFAKEAYDPREYRTVGDTGLDGPTQVAALIDFIDSDNTSFTRAGFDGEGLESQMPKGTFFNRKFASLGELLFVPGMTLERLMRIAPFVKVTDSSRNTQVNVNTVPIEVLLAMGFPERDAAELVTERTSAPIKNENLGTVALGDPQLKSYLKVTTDEFSVYVRVMSANTSRWLRASISAAPGTPRRTTVKSMELH